MRSRPVCENNIPHTNASFGVLDRPADRQSDRAGNGAFAVAAVRLRGVRPADRLRQRRESRRSHARPSAATSSRCEPRWARARCAWFAGAHREPLLAVLAGTVGLLFAWSGTVALRNWASGALPRAETSRSMRTFSLRARSVAGLRIARRAASGVAAFDCESRRGSPEGGPRSMGGRGGRRLHQGLVVAEIALAVVLLSGAGLLIRSFRARAGGESRIRSSNVLLLQVDLPGTYNNREKAAAFFTEATRTDSRAAGRRGCGRDQRLLHPPAAGLPDCARGPAAAAAR